MNLDTSKLATKQDILLLKQDLKDFEVSIKRAIVALAALQVAAVGVLVAAFKLF